MGSKRQFYSIEELRAFYFPEESIKYPLRMWVSLEEEELLLSYRGVLDNYEKREESECRIP